MKQIVLFLFLIISSLSFAQETKQCAKGLISVQRIEEFVNFIFIYDGAIYPSRKQKETSAYSFFFRTFLRYELAKYPNIIQSSKVETNLINSKAKITLCYESFKEQFLPFALGEVNELTLISQTGIPFLTFTRIE